jgi:hypothetical protein
MLKKLLLTAAAIGVASGLVARADTITFTGSGTGGDGPESASATITTGTNSLTVALSSLTANPTAAGQEVSGIFITLSSTPTSSPILSSASGTLIDIAPGGAVTPDGGTIDHWGTSLSGATVCLETAGTCAQSHTPVDLIIGPGPYTNANPSITGRNPQIQDTGTFVLSLNGIDSNTMVTGITFEFGTGPDSHITCSAVPGATPMCSPAVINTPEPSPLALLGTGALGLAGVIRRRYGRV